MQFDYFYFEEAEQFVFYRIPKKLFTDNSFKGLSADAKVLYGLMLDRMGLSRKNRWIDEADRVYICFGRQDAAGELNCGVKKAGKIIDELTEAGLIEKKRCGLGRPNMFYVKNFVREKQTEGAINEAVSDEREECPVQRGQNDLSRKVKMTHQERSKRPIKRGQNDPSREVRMTHPEGSKQPSNNTKENKTVRNNNYLSIYPSVEDRRIEVRSMIDYDAMVHDNPFSVRLIDEIVELIVEVMSYPPDVTLKIGGMDRLSFDVQKRFCSLNMHHILYALSSLEAASRTTEIKNIRGYMLTVLFYATMTMDSYYNAKANYDMNHVLSQGGSK